MSDPTLLARITWPLPVEHHLERGSLYWRFDASPRRVKLPPSEQWLLSFTRMDRRPRLTREGVLPEAVARWAGEWGVLRSHTNADGLSGRDSLAEWGWVIESFGGALRFAAALNSGNEPADQDRRHVASSFVGDEEVSARLIVRPKRSSRAFDRLLLQAFLNRALSWAGTAPRVDNALRLELEGDSLRAGLVIALWSAVQDPNLRPCAGCQRPIRPERPSKLRDAWCARCRKAGLPRRAARARYEAFVRPGR